MFLPCLISLPAGAAPAKGRELDYLFIDKATSQSVSPSEIGDGVDLEIIIQTKTPKPQSIVLMGLDPDGHPQLLAPPFATKEKTIAPVKYEVAKHGIGSRICAKPFPSIGKAQTWIKTHLNAKDVAKQNCVRIGTEPLPEGTKKLVVLTTELGLPSEHYLLTVYEDGRIDTHWKTCSQCTLGVTTLLNKDVAKLKALISDPKAKQLKPQYHQRIPDTGVYTITWNHQNETQTVSADGTPVGNLPKPLQDIMLEARHLGEIPGF